MSLLLLIPACESAAPVGTDSGPVAAGEFAGVQLTVACPDARFAAAFRPRAAAWAGTTGATVHIVEKPVADVPDADGAIVKSAQFGTLAAHGKLAGLPMAIRSGSRIPWDKLLDSYRKDLAGWGGVELGLPLAGDGYLLVYRADILAEPQHQQALKRQSPQTQIPPRSWEDVAEIAAYFSEVRGKPSLPAWVDDDHLAARFYQIAACYEREAANRSQAGASGPAVNIRSLEFLFDLQTGAPRLTRPGFVAALEWLTRSTAFRPTTAGDPVESLTRGSSVLAVLTLAELARLPHTATGVVAPQFAIAPLPGTESTFGADGQKVFGSGKVNAVPYLGAGGQIGVVFQSGKNQAAVWNLLAATAGLASSLAMLSEPRFGVGPFRNEHVYEDRCWLAYNFDPARTRKLTEALQRYVNLEISNPTFPLRIPDAELYQADLIAELRAAVTKQRSPVEALQRANAVWEKRSATVPKNDFIRWLRNSAGLQ
ncbi:MAG: hypothetical protein LC104_00695 [Bacteroidales bacterium]|nr:hypothetical protein [Bacteroidales bacterium]